MSQIVQQAKTIAARAHQGQTDKTGHPYIEHPGRVVEHVRNYATPADLNIARAVAWLHDTVEDTTVTLAELATTFPSEVVNGVDAITKRTGEDPDTYYARVRSNPIARAVKRADLDDNTDPGRVALLDEHTRQRLAIKYAHARTKLSGK